MRRKLLVIVAALSTFTAAVPLGAQEAPADPPVAQETPAAPTARPAPETVGDLMLPSPVETSDSIPVSKLDPSVLAADGPTDVIVTLTDDSLAESGKTGDGSQQAHVANLESKQDAFLQTAVSDGATPLGQTQRVLNAVFIRADAETLVELASDPSVVSIRASGIYHTLVDAQPQLDETVPYIGATSVQDLGVDGSGVRVAVLDSGIDYTHAAFGGPGTAEAYLAAYGADNSDPRNTTTDGLFPTARVVGGFDFVGESWDGTPSTPPLAPDPDPIDFEGHGTHVADIIGGASGVAPGVDLYALKVCSSVSTACSGVALIQAMEFAVDPNGDGKTRDAVDLINMSLGADYGQPFDDDLSAAVDGATKLGVLTVAAAGNAGDKPFITGTPAAAATALSVAQTQVPSATVPILEILTPEAIAGVIEDVAFQPWSVSPGAVIEANIQYGDGLGGNLDGCAAFAPGSLTGLIVLVDRGTCNFSAKISNISQAGGLAGIIGLVAPGAPFSGGDGGERPIDIPGYMINQDDSTAIKTSLAPGPVTLRIDPAGIPAVGQMVGSSARGPQFEDFRIKPEIGAPGASVSAIAGSGTGVGAFGGTSGATPMVTGAAALLIDGRGTELKNESNDGEDWKKKQDRDKRKTRITPLDLKALLMNNADTEIDVSPFIEDAPVTRIGAGEVRVDQAFGAPALAWVRESDGAALSFGHVDVAGRERLTKTIEVKNTSDERITYQVSATFRFTDDAESGAVRISTPSRVVVQPGKTRRFEVSIIIDGSKLSGNHMNSGSEGASGDALTINEFDGFITLDAGDERPISLPWQVLPRKAADVRAGTSSFPEGGHVVDLNNRGVGTAQLDAYALVAVDENLPEGERGGQSPTPDIRGIGVNTFLVPAGFCGAEASFIWAFAFDSWERHAHADFPATMWLDLNVDADPEPEYAVYNADVAGLGSANDGRTLTWVSEWVEYPNVIGNSSAFFFAEHATVTGNYALYICGDQIGMTQDNLFQPVGVEAFAFDFYFGGPSDEVDPFTISPFGERFLGIPNGDFTDIGPRSHGTLEIVDFTATGTDANLGVLLFTNGDRGPGNHGGATDETEALYFLME